MASLTLTDDLTAQLANAVRRGIPIETAAQAAGVSDRTFYEWLKCADTGTWSTGDPIAAESRAIILRFSQEIRRAQAEHEATVLERIQEAVESTNEKTGIPEWRAGAWLLNNHPRYRERYRQHRELEVHQQGTVTHEHHVAKTLQPDALDAAYKALHPPDDT